MAVTSVTARAGQAGRPGDEIALDDKPKDVLSGIGSCATGNGLCDGARLEYGVVVLDPTRVVPGEKKTVTVTFTFADR